MRRLGHRRDPLRVVPNAQRMVPIMAGGAVRKQITNARFNSLQQRNIFQLFDKRRAISLRRERLFIPQNHQRIRLPQRRREQSVRAFRTAVQFRVANTAAWTARLQHESRKILQFRQLPCDPFTHLRTMLHAVFRRHADFIAVIIAIQIHRDARAAQPAFAFRADWHKIHPFGKHIANHRAGLRPAVVTARFAQQTGAHSDFFPSVVQFRHRQSLCSNMQSP